MRRTAIVAAVTVAVAVALIVVLADGDEEPAEGASGEPTGATGGELTVLYAEDFSDPGSGWPDVSADGKTQGYVDGRYEIRLDEPAGPSAFVLATPPPGAVSTGDARIVVEVTILGESQSKRDGFGVSCRIGSGGAYYFILGTSGGWSIQKLPAGRLTSRTLVDSSIEPIAAPIRDVNRISADCTGPADGPVTLTLTVNGVELAEAVDAQRVLGPGSAGLAVAGPTEDSPAGLAVAFDDFEVQDLSSLDEPNG